MGFCWLFQEKTIWHYVNDQCHKILMKPGKGQIWLGHRNCLLYYRLNLPAMPSKWSKSAGRNAAKPNEAKSLTFWCGLIWFWHLKQCQIFHALLPEFNREQSQAEINNDHSAIL